MIAQDKYMIVYVAKQIEQALNNIVGIPSPKIRMATKSLTKQAQKIVSEEYSKAPPYPTTEDIAENDTNYWNNLNEMELHNIKQRDTFLEYMRERRLLIQEDHMN